MRKAIFPNGLKLSQLDAADFPESDPAGAGYAHAPPRLSTRTCLTIVFLTLPVLVKGYSTCFAVTLSQLLGRTCITLATGLSWDPVGSYLVSQADKRVRLWRTDLRSGREKWTQVHASDLVCKGVAEAGAVRPSFSADGTYISIPNDYKDTTAIAQMIRLNRSTLCLEV